MQNLNIVDASLKDVNVTEERDDIVGLNSVLEDMIKEKVAGTQGKEKGNQNAAIISPHANLEFYSMTATRRGFILGGSKG